MAIPAHAGTAEQRLGAESAAGHTVLWCAVGAGFTTLFDSATVAYVAPAAAESLNSPTAGLQWFLASYSLTFGLALVPWMFGLMTTVAMYLLVAGGFAEPVIRSETLDGVAENLCGFNWCRLLRCGRPGAVHSPQCKPPSFIR